MASAIKSYKLLRILGLNYCYKSQGSLKGSLGNLKNVAECTVKQRSMQRLKPGSMNRSGKV